MRAEHLRPDGSLEQGYYCARCGAPSNMLASSHGAGMCEPKPALVADLDRINATERARRMGAQPRELTAFPFGGFADQPAQTGMTLRDWFAGLAMQAMVGPQTAEQVASNSYRLADEMLKERAK